MAKVSTLSCLREIESQRRSGQRDDMNGFTVGWHRSDFTVEKQQNWKQADKLCNCSSNRGKRCEQPGLVWWQWDQRKVDRLTDLYRRHWVRGESKAWAAERAAFPFREMGSRGKSRSSVKRMGLFGSKLRLIFLKDIQMVMSSRHSWIFLEIPPYFRNRSLEDVETFWETCYFYNTLIKEK